MEYQFEMKVPGKTETVIVKPYGDVYWDGDRHLYNIFGLELPPDFLYLMANGGLDMGYGAREFKYNGNHSYSIIGYYGFKEKLQRLIGEPIEGVKGEAQLREFIKQQFERFLEENEVE